LKIGWKETPTAQQSANDSFQSVELSPLSKPTAGVGNVPDLAKSVSRRSWLQFIVENPFRILIPAFVITLLFAIQLPRLHFQTSIYDLAIEDLPETDTYRVFKKTFGSEEIILVVAKSENIFEPDTFNEIEQLARTLSRIAGVKRAISLPGIRKDMDITTRWTLSDFEKIITPVDLFHKNLISSDRKTAIISLILEDVEQTDQVVDSVEALIEKQRNGLSLYQIGMPLVSKALAEFTEQDFMRLPPIAFSLMTFMLFCFFRNIRGILIPAGSVLFALIWTFGLMAWTRTPLSMLTMIVPIFIIAVGTAYCMYIFPEYVDAARKSSSPKEVVYLCFSRIGFPTFLAVLTTSIGLGSVLLNRIHSIREFAIFSCVGIWSTMILILVPLPAILALLPLPPKKAGHGVLNKDFLDPLLRKITHLNLRHQKITLPVIALISLFGIAGIFRIRVETNPIGYFKKDAPVSQHFHDIYRDMAGSFPLNVVLESKTGSYFESPEHLNLISRLQRFLDSLDGVDKSISVVDYLRLVNYATNRYQKAYYALPEESFEVRMLMNSYKTMLGKDMVDRFVDGDLSKANILLRTHISSSKDFLMTKRKILDHLQTNFPHELEFRVTGFGIVISQSSHLLTSGQVKSLSLTLVLIFGIMFLLFLSGKVGLIAIVPNCFPIIIIFGLMGWLGIELSMVTGLIATVAVGLAVDDTIHSLVRYNQEFKKNLDKKRALQETIQSVGKPIIFTTCTIGIGFSILIFSHFRPTAVFGLMMVITMFSALVGDLILLPSLMTRAELVTLWDLLRLKLGKDPQKGLPLFKGLSRRQVHYILMAGALKRYGRGDVLFKKGETSDSMYAVIAGELEVVEVPDETDMENMFGTRKLISRLKTGDVVGEMGMVRSCRRSATVLAATPTELLQINDRMIKRLQWLYPPTAQKFFFNLMSIICDRLEYTTKCFTDVTTVDGLTGLQNCMYFMDALEKEIERSGRYGHDLSVFMMDLDNFNAVNHTFGRETGDRILSEIGKLIRRHVRKSDQACRYSGQQFAIMLINTSVIRARSTCERFRRLVAERDFETDSSPVYVTVSIGLASFDSGRGTSAESLMGMAGQALGRAKKAGRNCVAEHAQENGHNACQG
jgi:hydrophobe/amphiphile efflux-3 (HAE3) family protein